MNLEVSTADELVRIAIRGDLGVNDSSGIFRELAPSLHRDAVVEVDASGVERLDTSIAQLFVYLSSRVESVSVVTASPAWNECMRVLGLPHLAAITSHAELQHATNDLVG